MNRPLCLALACTLAAGASAQSTWFVDASANSPGSGTAQDPYSSLAFAIAQPSTLTGDTVLVAPGVYAESVDLLGKDLSIAGSTAGVPPEFVGDGTTSVFRFTSNETSACTLSGLTIRGTNGTDLGGVTHGGGAFIDGAAPMFLNVNFEDCGAMRGGALAILSGSAALDSCTLESNSAGLGGAIFVSTGVLTVDDSRFEMNTAGTVPGIFTSGGGAIATDPGAGLTVRNSSFELNRTTRGSGGAILSLGTGLLDTTEFFGNRTGSSVDTTGGGGAVAASSSTQGIDCHLEQNGDLYTQGGGGANGGHWIRTTFRRNACYNRGAGLNDAIAEDCWIVDNFIATKGSPATGGVGAADCDLLRCTIQANDGFAFIGGGTLDCDLVDCIVQANVLSTFDTAGAGIYGGTALRCLITDNFNQSSGTGAGAAWADLTQCVVARNIGDVGGGTYNCALDRCTVVQNYALSGIDSNSPPVGGVEVFLGGLPVRDCIIWGNVGAQIGAATQVTYSAVEGGFPGMGNIDLDPAFFGPGSDVHLTTGSPCIDAGDPASPPDPDGSRADMGAFAFDPAWSRTDGPMCAGLFDLEVSGSPSFSGPLASVASEGSSLFILGIDAQLTPIQLQGLGGFSFYSFHCFSRGARRLMPSSAGRLDLSPQLLSGLGLIPGDRIFVAAWNSTGATSITWDLGILP